MKTLFLLLAEFDGRADIPLEDVAKKYLDLSYAEASRRAARCELPFPAYRPGGTQKSPWLVRLSDLAEWLDQQAEKARKEWGKVNGRAA